MMRFAIIFFAAMLPLAAQSTSLQGVVTDPQGATIAGAVVTITNTETSAVRKEPTDENGVYRIQQVLPGPYKVEVQKPGFTTKASTVVLQVDLPDTLNVQLDVGQTSNVVNVTAETTTINTENATTGNPFTETQIENLPLQLRNVVALMSQEAGVTANGNVVGSTSKQNYVTVDGADVNGFTGTGGFSSAVPIPLDSVQEFRTTVNGQGADLGRGSGGQAAVVTKSGSNQFHGGLYEFNRNTDFEANDWFSNRAGVARPGLIRNQYGGTIGGPIKKNKLFFFYNFEGRQDRSQAAKTDVVPSATFREGLVGVQLKTGGNIELTPAQVQQIDPLGIGENPYMLQLFQQYPQGNNPLSAADKGLNLNDLTFNAAQPYHEHTQVGKIDYNINSRMTFSIRGTLDGTSQVSTSAQFPGQAPSQTSLSNPRNLGARYTYVISANIVNAFNFGYTRSSSSQTGNENIVPSIVFTPLTPTPREQQIFTPVQSYNDDLTWNKGKHTIQFGGVWHHATTATNNYNNLPGYSFSNNTLLNLGGDIQTDALAVIQKLVPGAALASTSNLDSAFGASFGLLNAVSGSYNYTLSGNSIPFGQPVDRAFATSSPEFYAQDSWKVKSNLTITYGLRYSIYGVPYETGGVQLEPTIPVNEYFAQRQASANLGVPGWAAPDANITYELGGPINHGPGYYPETYNDLAPRFGLAYQPKGELEKFLGKGSVIRASYGIVYDNYGNDLAASLASGGTPGLVSSIPQASNLNYTTGSRYNGTSASFPAAVPPAAGITFPYTPPLQQAQFNQFTEVSGDLKAPYEHLISINYARPLPKHMSIEIGYAGRLSHRGLITQDYGQPLSQFVDPKSGQTWQQAAGALALLHDEGLTQQQVKANPNLVPLQPFIQDMFPTAAATYLPGASASAAVFYDAFADNSGSWLDTLNTLDRNHVTGAANTLQGCITITGCNTFYMTQNSGIPTTTNSGQAAYNGLLISLRRTVTHGWGYDFNYTFSHAIDNDLGGEIQNAFNPSQNLGPAGFDQRQTINANFVVELPVGKGKTLGSNMPMWADEVVGGWQLSSLYTFYTGSPINCSASSQYNVNYQNSSSCNLYPGLSSPPPAHLQFDNLGVPSFFANPNVAADFVPGLPGIPGYVGLYRGLDFWNDDMALNKNFRLPREGMRATLRIEAYNVFNHEVFGTPSLGISSNTPGTTTFGSPSNFGSTTFGEITKSASTPRVLQAVLRFTF
ncbi:MAG TPA: TonB-dependent receptor [Bryobacteraceae bacterium]|jgi:hypothetical protein